MLFLALIFMLLYPWQTEPGWNTFYHDRRLTILFLDFPKGILHSFRSWVRGFFSLSVSYTSWSCRIVLINLMCRTATKPFTADKNLREMPLRSLITAFTRKVLNPKWTDYVSAVSHSSPTDVLQSGRHQHQKWKPVLHSFSVKWIIIMFTSHISGTALSRVYIVLFWENKTGGN